MPRKFTLEIRCDSAAFDDDMVRELKRLLKLARWSAGIVIHDPAKSYTARLPDRNGNAVGSWSYDVWEENPDD